MGFCADHFQTRERSDLDTARIGHIETSKGNGVSELHHSKLPLKALSVHEGCQGGKMKKLCLFLVSKTWGMFGNDKRNK